MVKMNVMVEVDVFQLCQRHSTQPVTMVCDGEDICDGNGNCIGEPPRCDSNPVCNNQCNEVEHNCFSDPGTLCLQGECTGCVSISIYQTDWKFRKWYLCCCRHNPLR